MGAQCFYGQIFRSFQHCALHVQILHRMIIIVHTFRFNCLIMITKLKQFKGCCRKKRSPIWWFVILWLKISFFFYFRRSIKFKNTFNFFFFYIIKL